LAADDKGPDVKTQLQGKPGEEEAGLLTACVLFGLLRFGFRFELKK
jgi:hypothetical protein